jgi:hypothetical protein
VKRKGRLGRAQWEDVEFENGREELTTVEIPSRFLSRLHGSKAAVENFVESCVAVAWVGDVGFCSCLLEK